MQQLLRKPMLAVADSDRVEGLVRRHARGLVNRFVAGEDLEAAVAAVKGVAAQGMSTTLDQLGENVSTVQEAEAAADTYVTILERLAAEELEPNISIKLTMLGLDLGDKVANDLLTRVLAAARDVNGFVRIDMEGSAYTERTVAITEEQHAAFPGIVGTVIQSYLKRSEADLERLIAAKIRVRLVKGAYAEPGEIAFRDHKQVDDSYLRLMRRLLDAGVFPALATHDPDIIDEARDYVRRKGVRLDQFEFQMLYGVRRDAQDELSRAGYGMRIYVPFGTEWYPYFTRRIAERPANAMFVLRQFVGR
jgi:proline dehydrogenase